MSPPARARCPETSLEHEIKKLPKVHGSGITQTYLSKRTQEVFAQALKIAGTLKDEYIRAVKAAGFEDVKIMDETSFPMELIENDPVSKKIIKDLEISSEDTKEVVSSVKSIKVYGKKPAISV